MNTNSRLVLKLPTILAAVLVRAILILHNLLAVWRVGIAWDSADYWVLAAGNVFTVFEGVLVVHINGGIEWKWWCPCFLSYILTTLPAVWLLQISQYQSLINSRLPAAVEKSIPLAASLSYTNSSSVGDAMVSSTAGISRGLSPDQMTSLSSMPQTTVNPLEASITAILSIRNDTWIVLIQESLVYLLVFGRWILPRSSYSREALADLLLGFLAMASDIMELYAVFDEERIKGNLHLTYVILTIWSVSFFQFVPVFAHKQKFRHLESARARFIRQACGKQFAHVVVTCLSIFLQDGPFLCLRLYIMIEYNLVTYSLVFFVLKNIVTLMLLLYRLGVLCVNLPCCYNEVAKIVEVNTVDFSAPVVFQKPSIRTPEHFRGRYDQTLTSSLNSYDMIKH